jgi:hypothetical protein
MLQMAEMFTREIYDQVSEKMFGHTYDPEACSITSSAEMP